jgi:2,3-bisphosphoglycerate-dependent phosphoglycerate mutase
MLRAKLQQNFGDFAEVEEQLEFLRDNDLFQEMSQKKFDMFKSSLRLLHEGIPLTSPQEKSVCSESEFFEVRSESLADTEQRVLKWLRMEYLFWNMGETVLVVSHSNTLRGLLKFLLCIEDSLIPDLHIPTGTPLLVDIQGLSVTNQSILSKESDSPIWSKDTVMRRHSSYNNTSSPFESVCLF